MLASWLYVSRKKNNGLCQNKNLVLKNKPVKRLHQLLDIFDHYQLSSRQCIIKLANHRFTETKVLYFFFSEFVWYLDIENSLTET